MRRLILMFLPPQDSIVVKLKNVLDPESQNQPISITSNPHPSLLQPVHIKLNYCYIMIYFL